jgi:putative tryptophan/tyrosine transport system substrate-binding protein
MARNLLRLVLCAVVATLAAPSVAQQPTTKIARIGYLAGVSASADAPRWEAFRQGLRELGYVEGQNVVLHERHLGRDLDRLPEAAAELVATKPDILVAVTTNAALAAKRAAGNLPIVFMGVTDPIAAGLVESLPRPGTNATGITNVAAVLAGKRLEILKKTIPRLSRVAVLWDPQAPGSLPQWKESHQPAGQLGLQLWSMEVSSAERYEPAFKDAVKAGNGAVWITLNPLANSNQKLIAEIAASHRLPSICARSDYAENGCLMAYGPSYSSEGSSGARYVDRILKGAKPDELPVEQPTIFELVVNLQTAKRIGVTIPRAVLVQADVVIQ